MRNPFLERISRRRFLASVATGAVCSFGRKLHAASAPAEPAAKEVYLVPNFHPASCGWLTTFSKERVYCANSYLDHLDRVRDDPKYKFVLSEVNNMIAIMNFHPERIEEIKQRVKEGRVELVNAFFLECTVNLSGGEALIKQVVEGLRWQEKVMGFRPRFAWTIDVCGTHDQMGQMCAGLGLEAMVYTRMNRTGSTLHWAESPDGSRVLALCPGHYSEFAPFFKTKDPLSREDLQKLEKFTEEKQKTTPAGAPILILGGSGDYNLAPLRTQYPSEFLEQWKQVNPQTKIQISTLGDYVDAVLPGVKSGEIQIPTMRGGTGYTFDSFWIENPRVKTWYRRNEHGLQAAESLATIASLVSKYQYPVQTLYDAWVQMLLNTDRNSLWGSAGGMVFENDKSWDIRDRMESVEKMNSEVQTAALKALTRQGKAVTLFNPLNWERNDPVLVRMPEGKGLEGAVCQSTPEGSVLCRLRLPSVGITGAGLSAKGVESSRRIDLPDTIETKHYQVRIDRNSGALDSLKLKPSGREMLGGPANVVVAEKPKSQKGDPGDFMLPRPERIRLASSSDFQPTVAVTTGPVATTVEFRSEFYGGSSCRRMIRIYQDYPRIDFETELQDIPDRTVVVAEFPLAEEIEEVRRGIPNGFSHGAWAKPNPELYGWAKGIVPAVQWTHYAFAGGGGVAVLDRGVTGRELNGKTPIIYLLNAADKYYGYPNPWLSGKGKRRLAYALVAHEGDWARARIPQMAWEFNSPAVVTLDRTRAEPRSFVKTSDNMIVQALRREGREIEIRLIECLGIPGMAEVTVGLPHRSGRLTDFLGRNPTALERGPAYRFPVRAQQIVTLRFRTASAVDEVQPILRWDPLVPKAKLEALHTYGDYKGHPPRGD